MVAPQKEERLLKSDSGQLLRAGAAIRDITPLRDGLPLAGHGQNRTATGVRDPLHVRTLYLSSSGVEISLSVLDLVGLRRVHVDGIRDRLKGVCHPESALIFCTHTHSGPDTVGMWGPRLLGLWPKGPTIDPQYLERVQAQTAACIQEARERAVAAYMKVGCVEMPRNLTRNVRRSGFKEDNLSVLHFEDPGGRTLAVLANYPCHPELLGSGNRRVSADFPAALHRVVEGELGGVSLFIQHALGGLVTGGELALDGAEPRTREAAADRVGEMLGRAVVEAVRLRSGPVEPLEPLRFARREFIVPVRNRRIWFAARRGLFPLDPQERASRAVRTEIALIQKGPVRMVTLPGEPLPEIGFQVQAILNCRYPFLLCLGSDELGYILPERYAGLRRYRYENVMSLGPAMTVRLLREIRILASSQG